MHADAGVKFRRGRGRVDLRRRRRAGPDGRQVLQPPPFPAQELQARAAVEAYLGLPAEEKRLLAAMRVEHEADAMFLRRSCETYTCGPGVDDAGTVQLVSPQSEWNRAVLHDVAHQIPGPFQILFRLAFSVDRAVADGFARPGGTLLCRPCSPSL
jgi:hypothetical protein